VDIELVGFPEMTVGNALATEAAHSNTTIAKVFSLLRDNTLFPPHTKRTEALYYRGSLPALNYNRYI
jgi:hypothetical protein